MNTNFYPRSPCGERREKAALAMAGYTFLSTLSLRRATEQTAREQAIAAISIHALLAESDAKADRIRALFGYFYPRSPCGERHVPLAVPDLGKRFLSTLSLRRATAKVHKTVGHFCAYETNFMEIASSC